MAASASFAVKRSAEVWQRGALLFTHVAAGATGGVLAGLLLSVIGAELPSSWRVPSALAIGTAVALLDLGGVRLPQPGSGVPAEWQRWSPPTYLTAYGLVLGSGLITPYGAAAIYGFAGLVLVRGDAVQGALVFGVYGAARALASMTAAVAMLDLGVGDVARFLEMHRGPMRPVLAALALAAALGTIA